MAGIVLEVMDCIGPTQRSSPSGRGGGGVTIVVRDALQACLLRKRLDGLGRERIARAWAKLMAKPWLRALGGAGGDGGRA